MDSVIMENATEIDVIIKQFVVETTYTPADKLNCETLIFVQGIFDSMGFISLINFIEERFGIRADDSELLEENFESINAISNFVRRKLQ
ncbi:MAG: acyl carrier protein [Bacteroidetes bacterium]|nr:acyl carrier protein [Bacteroidota bacterium]